MELASRAGGRKVPPRELGQAILAALPAAADLIEKAEIAGPGFINFTAAAGALAAGAGRRSSRSGAAYGRSALGKGARVQVEFVSANPTGPLHLGHGRGAAVGDILCRILEATGHARPARVLHQRRRAGRSRRWRARCSPAAASSSAPRRPSPRTATRASTSATWRARPSRGTARRWPTLPDERGAGGPRRGRDGDRPRLDPPRPRGLRRALRRLVLRALALPARRLGGARGASCAGATCSSSRRGRSGSAPPRFGDDKDRVVVKNDGSRTYLASDILYHADKFRRGFDRVIDIWGADHHGYIPRMQAVVAGARPARGRARGAPDPARDPDPRAARPWPWASARGSSSRSPRSSARSAPTPRASSSSCAAARATSSSTSSWPRPRPRTTRSSTSSTRTPASRASSAPRPERGRGGRGRRRRGPRPPRAARRSSG